MNKTTKKWLGAALALLAAAVLGTDAKAANPAILNIDVSVTANLSVNVNGVQSSTYTGVTWNTASQAKIVGSSATVTNDSGAQTEKWALSTDATSMDQGTGGAWTLNTSSQSVGADQFALQAVFGSSATASGGCPASASGDWDSAFATPLTATPATYTHAVFADSNLNNGGNGSLLLYNPDVATGGGDGRIFAAGKRALCWRIITPTTTSSVDAQNVQVIITAQNP